MSSSVTDRAPIPARSLCAILLVALAVRVIWALFVPVMPISDSEAYEQFARNIAAGHGYGWEPGQRSAFWPVGTAAVYATFFRLWGHHYGPIVVFQILVNLLTIFLTMQLAWRWFDAKVAVWTGLLLACWPLQIEFTTVLASELLFTACVIGMLWCWSTTSWSWLARAVAMGVCLAAASYLRPIALLLPVVMCLAEIQRDRSWRQPLAVGMVSLLVMVALILPWSFRNQRVFGEFVLISTNGGVNFWMGNHVGGDGGFAPMPDDVRKLPEVERGRVLKAEALAYIRAEPLAFVRRTFGKLITLHARETIGVRWNQRSLNKVLGGRLVSPLKAISSLYWYAVLVLALGGAGWLLRRERLAALLHPTLLLWGYFAAVHAVIVVQDRYHMPSTPWIAILAALTLATWVGPYRRSACDRRPETVTMTAGSLR